MVKVLDSIECKNCVSAFNKLYFYIQDTQDTERIWVHPEVIRTEVKVIKHKNYLRKVSHFAELENSVLVRTSDNEYLMYHDDYYNTVAVKVDGDEKVEVESYDSDLTVRIISNIIFITARKTTTTTTPTILLRVNEELYWIDTKEKKLKRVYSKTLPPSSFGIDEDTYGDIIECGASRGTPVYMKDYVNKFAKNDAKDIEDDIDVVDY